MSVDVIDTTRSPERQALIDNLESSIDELAPTIRPRMVQPEDYLADIDPAVQIARKIGSAIGRGLREIRDVFETVKPHQTFHHELTEEELAVVQEMLPWQMNKNYVIGRLMRAVVEVLKSSPAETLEQDVRDCITRFTKENPHVNAHIYDSFFEQVRKCSLAEGNS